LASSPPFLEIRSLTKGYGGLIAVKDISLDIQKGEILGLIGPNGAGKTTLFNLITGMEQPDSGDVFFEGKSIKKLKPHSICKLGISRTYQSVRPFLNHTVRENVTVGALYGRRYPKEVDSSRKVDEIIDLLNLTEKQDHLARSLPIEERKMVEVGRALAANPKLLMLDEPMAGLNPTEVAEFVSFVRKLKDETEITIVIVEHVMRAISSSCTRVVVLHHGEMLAEGTPSEVLSDEKVVEVYLGESYARAQSKTGSSP
jgi:branched-chain amino acid transport system ATP-binding protein